MQALASKSHSRRGPGLIGPNIKWIITSHTQNATKADPVDTGTSSFQRIET
jgi:hypothetical protein